MNSYSRNLCRHSIRWWLRDYSSCAFPTCSSRTTFLEYILKPSPSSSTWCPSRTPTLGPTSMQPSKVSNSISMRSSGARLEEVSSRRLSLVAVSWSRRATVRNSYGDSWLGGSSRQLLIHKHRCRRIEEVHSHTPLSFNPSLPRINRIPSRNRPKMAMLGHSSSSTSFRNPHICGLQKTQPGLTRIPTSNLIK